MKNIILFIVALWSFNGLLAQTLTITTQEQLNTLLPETLDLYQRLDITSSPVQDSSTMVTDLTPLLMMDSLPERLHIYNTILTNLDGLQNIPQVRNFYVYNNLFLEDASQLQGPKAIENLKIFNNPQLTKVGDFSEFDFIAILEIFDNPKLESLQIVLPKLKSSSISIYERTGLDIYSCEQLLDVEIDDPNHVLHRISVDSMPSLQHIHLGVSNDTLPNVFFHGNDELISVSGFINVDFYNYVVIRDNPLLNELCFLQKALTNYGIAYYNAVGSLPFFGNGSGANSAEEILATDCSNFNVGVEELNQTTLSLYPNPAHNEVFVEAPKTITNYRIYDMSGKTVKTGAVEPNGRIGLHGISGGMYILQVNENRSKLVIQ